MTQSSEMDTDVVTWGTSVDGLRLGLAAERGNVLLALENVGDMPLTVLSHVEAGEIHLDWYRLQLTDDQGTIRTVRLRDERDESGVVHATLQPHAQVSHSIKLAHWTKRAINNSQPLAAGNYRVMVTYTVANAAHVWNGHLEAGPVKLTVAAE